MNIKDFQTALIENYDKYNGPFHWLTSECELGVFAYLSDQQKKLALNMVYSKYLMSIGNIDQGLTPVEKIFRNPTKHQELFELILCSTLIKLHLTSSELSCFSIGEFRLPDEVENTQKLKKQFGLLKNSIQALNDAWAIDCQELWGEVALLDWIDCQIGFLHGIINAELKKENKRNDSFSYFRDHLCVEVVDYEDLTFEQAQDKLDVLVGLQDVKRRIHHPIAHRAYNEARAVAHNVNAEPAFNNFIIAGPPGVGKTTLARILAGLLATSGVLKKKSAAFTTTSLLIGEYIGVTEKNVTNLFKHGRGGAIIIDEADTLAMNGDTSIYHEAAINTLNTLTGYEKDNDTGTLVILTGYEQGITQLFNSNPGLRRRFPHYLALPALEATTFKELFLQKIRARGYEFDPAILDVALKEIYTAKDHMHSRFGNAGAVEEFLSVMETGRAKRIGLSTLQSIARRETTDDELLQSLSQLTLQDIPKFDKELETFKCSNLSLVKTDGRHG